MGIGEIWSALGGRIYEYKRPRRPLRLTAEAGRHPLP
jgi:hypothetical protein